MDRGTGVGRDFELVNQAEGFELQLLESGQHLTSVEDRLEFLWTEPRQRCYLPVIVVFIGGSILSQFPPIGDFERELWSDASRHIRNTLKAFIIGGFLFFAVLVFSASILKATLIAVLCLIASAFATWRRYLEPVSFWAFAAAAVIWCQPDLIASAKVLMSDTRLLILR